MAKSLSSASSLDVVPVEQEGQLKWLRKLVCSAKRAKRRELDFGRFLVTIPAKNPETNKDLIIMTNDPKEIGDKVIDAVCSAYKLDRKAMSAAAA